MTVEKGTNLSRRRVVVLSPDAAAFAPAGRHSDSASAGEAAGAGLEFIRVGSAYEAAAELVAAAHAPPNGPVLALVVDLRLLSHRHLRLLQIARQGGAEVLAVGGIPPGLTAEDLSGVRLLARAELPAMLRKLAQPPAERRSSPSPPPSAADEGRYVSDAPVPEADEPEAAPPVEPAQAEPAAPLPGDSPPRAARADPRIILTKEELAALLEDEP